MAKMDIGAELHKAAKRHKLTITEIVERAGYRNQSIFYRHKAQEDLAFDILYKYAKVMDYYFANEIPEFTEWLRENGLIKEIKGKLSYEDMEKKRDLWRDKYYALLEKYNKLLEERN